MEYCLVGNGPLSDRDKWFINSSFCDVVVRFNDMKNSSKGDRCDIHAIRSDGNKYHGIRNPPNVDLGCKQFLVIGTGGMNNLPDDLKIGEVIENVHSVYNRTSDITYSSGSLAINHYNSVPDIHKIHTFGMNFNLTAHHKRKEMNLHSQHCEKCIIHSTYKDSYLP
jgi:hypothetical protein